MTLVGFVPRAVVYIGRSCQCFHLQSPQIPVVLAQVAEWLRDVGYGMEGETRDEWIKRMEDNEKNQVVGCTLKSRLL
jgi:hypothetical protein